MAQNTVEILIKLVDQASKEFEAIKAGGAGMEAALKNLPRTFDEMDNSLGTLAKGVKLGIVDQETYRQALEATSKSLTEHIATLDPASSAYTAAIDTLSQVRPALEEVTSSLQSQNLNWGNLAETVKTNFTAGMQQGSSIATASVQSLGASFGAMVSPIGLATAGLGLVSAGAVALGHELIVATDVAQGFENALDGASAVLKASGEDSTRLAEAAKTLGADLNAGAIGATKAAEVIEQLGSSGLETADILGGGLKAALTTAAATGVNDFTKVAEVVAGTKAAFGLLPADLPRVSDLITNAMNVSQLKVDSFAQALAAGGSTAKSTGTSLTDFTAVISLMSDRLIQGSDAGTSFKSFVAAMTPQAGKASDAFKALNLDFYEADGRMKSLESITKMLTTAFSGMTQKQRDTNAELIFGSDGIRVFNTLLDAGVQGLQKRKGALDQMGSADEAAATRMKNAEGAQKNLTASIENFNIAIGKGLLPMKADVLNFLADMAKKFTGMAGDADLASEALRKFNEEKNKSANIDPGLDKGNQLADVKNKILDLQKQLAVTPKDAPLFAVINAKLQEQIALSKQLQSELSELYTNAPAKPAPPKKDLVVTPIPLMDESFDKVIAKAGHLQRALDAAKKSGDALKFDAAQQALDKFTDASDRNKRALEAYNATQTQTARATGATTVEVVKLIPEAERLEKAFRAATPGTADWNAAQIALKNFTETNKGGSEALSLAKERLDAVKQSQNEATQASEKARREAEQQRKEDEARADTVRGLSLRLRDLNEEYRKIESSGKVGADTLENYKKKLRDLTEDADRQKIKFGELSAVYRNQIGPLEQAITVQAKFAAGLSSSIDAANDAIKKGGKDGLEKSLTDLNGLIRAKGFSDLEPSAKKEAIKARESLISELGKIAGFEKFTAAVKTAVSAAAGVLATGNDGQIAAQVKRLEEIIGKADFKKLPKIVQDSVTQMRDELKVEPVKRFGTEVQNAIADAARAIASGENIPQVLEKLNVLMKDKKYSGLGEGMQGAVPAAVAGLEAMLEREFRSQGFNVPINIKPTLSQVSELKPDLERIVGPISFGMTEALIAGDWTKFGDILKLLTDEQLTALQDWISTQDGPIAETIQEVLERAAKTATAKPIPIKFNFSVQADAVSDQVQAEISDVADLGVQIDTTVNLENLDEVQAAIDDLKDKTGAFATEGGQQALQKLITSLEDYKAQLESADQAQQDFNNYRANREAEMPAVTQIQDIVLEVDQNSLTAIQAAIEAVKAKAGEIKTEAGQASFDKALAQLEQMAKLAPDINFSGEKVDLGDQTEAMKAAADDLEIAKGAVETAFSGIDENSSVEDIQTGIETLTIALSAMGDGSTEAKATLERELDGMMQLLEAARADAEVPIPAPVIALGDLELELARADAQYKNGSLSASEYLDRIADLQARAGDLSGAFGTTSDEGIRLKAVQDSLASSFGTGTDALIAQTDAATALEDANNSLNDTTDEGVQKIADENEAREKQRQLEADLAAERAAHSAELKTQRDYEIAQTKLGIEMANDLVSSQQRQIETAKLLGASGAEIKASLEENIAALQDEMSVLEVGSDEWLIYAKALAAARGQLKTMASDELKAVMTGIQQVAGFVTQASNAIKSFSEGGSKDVLGLIGSLTKVAGSIVEVAAGIPGLGAVVGAVVDAVTAVVDMAVSVVVGGNKKISESGKKSAEEARALAKEYGAAFNDLAAEIDKSADVAGDFWTNLFNKDWANANALNAENLQKVLAGAKDFAGKYVGVLAGGIAEGIKSGDFEESKRAMLEKMYDTFVGSILQMAVATTLASGRVGQLMIDLQKEITNAIATGDWSKVNVMVGQITDEAGKAFTNFMAGAGSKLKNPYAKDTTPKDGSIAALERDKAKLEDKFKNTTDQGVRDQLKLEIDAKEAEIKRLKGEAVKAASPDGSIAALEDQKRALEEQRNLTTDQAVRDRLKLEIADKEAEIKRLKGEVEAAKTDSTKTTTSSETKRNTVGGSYASVTSLVASLPTEWLSSFNIFEGSVNKFDGSVNKFDTVIARAESMYRQVDAFYASLRLNGIEAHVNTTPATSALPAAVYTK